VRGYRWVLAVAVIVVTPSSRTYGREMDNAKITCGAFLASGRANMAALISWLRGYHAGKTGVIPYQYPDPYGGRLGFYCKQHPNANLVDASGQILSEIDRGI
jgi:hypothetical protein